MSKDKEVESIEHIWKGGWEGKKQETRNEARVILWKGEGQREEASAVQLCSFVHICIFLLHCKLLGQKHARL